MGYVLEINPKQDFQHLLWENENKPESKLSPTMLTHGFELIKYFSWQLT